jgi:hypothetical protein
MESGAQLPEMLAIASNPLVRCSEESLVSGSFASGHQCGCLQLGILLLLCGTYLLVTARLNAPGTRAVATTERSSFRLDCLRDQDRIGRIVSRRGSARFQVNCKHTLHELHAQPKVPSYHYSPSRSFYSRLPGSMHLHKFSCALSKMVHDIRALTSVWALTTYQANDEYC